MKKFLIKHESWKEDESLPENWLFKGTANGVQLYDAKLNLFSGRNQALYSDNNDSDKEKVKNFKPYKCDECESAYASSSGLSYHIETKH